MKMTTPIVWFWQAPEGRNKSYSPKRNVGFLSFKETLLKISVWSRVLEIREEKKATRVHNFIAVALIAQSQIIVSLNGGNSMLPL